jgi:hypothetical protein
MTPLPPARTMHPRDDRAAVAEKLVAALDRLFPSPTGGRPDKEMLHQLCFDLH